MESASRNELVIVRIFDAPRELVWKYWTEPEYYKRWWGPKDFTAPEAKLDFRVGGKNLSCMQSPDGQKFWSTGEYKEIVPMERIVVTDSFADEQGNVVPATYYGMERMPLVMEVTVTFEDQGGKTKMTLKHAGIAEMDDKNREDMTQGWQESFDKMASALATA